MTIWALGSNGSGQLGIGSTDDCKEPAKVKMPNKFEKSQVQKVVAGGNHTIFLLETWGHVLASGENEDGRCGDTEGNPTSILTPQQVAINPGKGDRLIEFHDVSATWSASFFVDKNDRRRIFVRGTGSSGELGLGERTTLIDRSNCIMMPSPIRSIVSCLAHTVVVLVNGDVWGWGKGRKGQLGTPAENCWSPRRIDVGFPVEKAVCGADFTCFLSEPRQGQIKLIGSDAKDRHGLRKDCPEAVHGWSQAVASWGGLAIQTPSKLITWGRNERHQRMSTAYRNVLAIATGSEHWILLQYDGTLIVGGWGEHGNCGPRQVTSSWPHGAIISEKGLIGEETPSRIFGGCATTFITTLPQSNIP